MSKSSAAGRPPATSREELEAAALQLFASGAFDAVTVDDIAAAAGVSRRTFFRYYPSKNDVVWGAFDDLLDDMDRWLAATPDTVPVLDAVADAVVRFNSLPPDAVAAHRQRMALILRVPALQAHGTLRYAEWRAVIARYVSGRLGVQEASPVPQLVGHVSLGVAMAAYEQWLADTDADLVALLEADFAHLRAAFSELGGHHRLGDERSPDLAGRTPVLLVPLGSVEQHGPHLPLDTDTRIATAVASAAADALQSDGIDALVAPAIPVGSSGEHAGFPGTLSIGQDALEAMVVELVRSADAFSGVVLVCGHGGNARALHRAIASLAAEGRRAVAWFPSLPEGDAHAGRTETSLLLRIAPEAVAGERAAPGNTEPLPNLLPAMRRGGVAAVSPNGVLGDPTGASAAEGAQLLGLLVADLVSAVGGSAGD